MTQLPLPLSRALDPATSHAAAHRAREFRARHEALILDALRVHGPMTAREIASVIRLDSVQISRRGREMQLRGLVSIGPHSRNGCRIWEARYGG